MAGESDKLFSHPDSADVGTGPRPNGVPKPAKKREHNPKQYCVAWSTKVPWSPGSVCKQVEAK